MSEATDFMRLAADHVSDCLDQDGQGRLAHLVTADPAACKALADQVVVDCMLRREALQTIDVDKIMRDVLRSEIPKRNCESSLPTIDVDKIMRAVLRSEIPTVQRTHPASATVKRPKSSRSLRKFSALPKRRRSPGRSPWLSSLVAVLIVSCVLAMTVTYMNRDAANRGVIAATVQDGNGAIWGQPPRVPGSNRIVRNTLDLRAGIAEISFATGATVIIEGPTVIELTGPNQAQLSLGRASAYVPPPASGFTLVSEGLTAVDRGTAFGLSRSADMRVELHVFSGAVEAQSPAASASFSVNASSAVQRDPRTGALTAIPCRPLHFYRALHSRELILDVADLVAGGDGRGSAIADGIDPDTGDLVSSPLMITRASDGQYHRVNRAPAIDGVFVPRGDQVITSQGHRFAFPPTDGKAYDIIRRGGIKADIHIIPAIFDGVNYATPEHTVIGMHANSGFTVALAAIAQNHPGMLVERFTARVANFHMNTSAHFWVIIDGVLVKHFRDLNSKKVAEHIDVLIPVGSRFLTFVSTDSSKDSNYLWVNVGDPKLRLRSIP